MILRELEGFGVKKFLLLRKSTQIKKYLVLFFSESFVFLWKFQVEI